MRPKQFLFFLSFCFSSFAFAQAYHIHGKIVNTKFEPLAFVSIQIKGERQGTTSKEDGNYDLILDEGKYDLVITMIGYKARVITIVVDKKDLEQNIILEEEADSKMTEIIVKGKAKDRSEEMIRNVIRNKEKILSAPGAYSCDVYIKAVQQDSIERKKQKKTVAKDSLLSSSNADLYRMAMAEVSLRLDCGSADQLKEQRIGVKKRGGANDLFFLSSTDGDFNFYHNLIKSPALSQVPFLSPISYSGLLAYRFKLVKTEIRNGRKIYTISVKPRQLSNATVEGEVVIEDSLWVLLHTDLKFPSYHLPEYDFFEVVQDYELVKQSAWMITRQEFIYYSKSNRSQKSGQTTAAYSNFELNKTFDKKYFGTEISATSLEAYEKDSSFWHQVRSEPLTQKELRFVNFRDSIFRATHTKTYLDSMDKLINRITWKKVLFFGQNFNDHEKERHWYIPPLPNIYQPLQLGGTRIQLFFVYSKTYRSKKNITVTPTVSYGLRNKDLNGSLSFTKMYNPFNRGFFRISGGRDFQYIFQGDAWINMLKRSNIYLNQYAGVGHGLELVNGLMLYTDLDLSFRKSVSSYKTNSNVDSVLGGILDNNHAIAFDSYNAVYGKIRLQYTPFQKYIREPREKIILGSAWPTFYTLYRKGVPGIFNSKVDFDYLEFGLEQEIKLGLAGTSTYSILTGNFLNRKDLRLVDYKFQRRGDPILFMNPQEAFQSLDSTFPVFHRFYQGHYIHEFNGFLLNRIPIFKKLQLREIAGAGFLIAPERNLRYVETFAGIERVFKWPFIPDTKFKLGVYVVGSAANQYRNPVQFKIGITSWDRRRNKWF